MDGAALGEHPLLEKRTRFARLQHRRADHSRQRNSDYSNHHWRWTPDDGILTRTVQRWSARNRHRVSDRPRGQGSGANDYDGDAYDRRIAAGTGSAAARGKKNGDSGIDIAERRAPAPGRICISVPPERRPRSPALT